jgi:hypothetical protein
VNPKLAILASLLVISVIALVTALQIEYLNWKSGGVIERKARQEPNSKSRGSEGFTLASGRAGSGTRTKYALDSTTSLSGFPCDQEVCETTRAQSDPVLHSQLDSLLRGRALFQIPLGIMLVIGGFVGSLYTRTKLHERLHFIPLGVGVVTLFFAFYRDYFTAAGW